MYEANIRVARIIWGAFLFSQIIYAGVFWYLVKMQPPDPSMPRMVLYLFTSFGVLFPAASGLVRRLFADMSLRRLDDDEREAAGPAYMSPFIIGLALAESGALFAGVGLFLFGDAVFWAVPAGVAFAMTLVAIPSAQTITEAFNRTHGGGAR